jgi:putative lipoic acid-binding regulatory protein
MEFPTEFSLKVFGASDTDIEVLIVSVVRQNQVDIECTKISTRPSSGGKYNSYTVTFTAESQEQLDNIYRALSSNEQVLMVL